MPLWPKYIFSKPQYQVLEKFMKTGKLLGDKATTGEPGRRIAWRHMLATFPAGSDDEHCGADSAVECLPIECVWYQEG